MWVWDVLEDGEEYECASVLLHHTQDVKSVQWHPKEPVNLLFSQWGSFRSSLFLNQQWCVVFQMQSQ